jgi:phosphoglycolate phosphatase
MMYDFILFDFDGTVYDTVEGITRSVRYALNKHGWDAELADLRCFAGPPLDKMFMEKYGVSSEMGLQMTEEYRERYKPIGIYESRPFDGIGELLTALRAAGKKTAVATSKPQYMAETLLERSGLHALFDVICGSQATGGGNAKWQVTQRALDALGADRARSVLIGDTKWDVEGAARVGIPCIGVRYGYAAPGEMEAAGAIAMAEDTKELLALLLQ